MIVSVQSALEYLGQDIPEDVLKRKIKAMERLIRDETNNNFQNRAMRFKAPSRDNVICGSSPYIEVGDTIEINGSINEGVYTVTEIQENTIRVDRNLYMSSSTMITRVIYPESVQEGVLTMLKWEFEMRSKTGIKSETLSRHSVTYFDMDASNSLDGYPASIVGFLDPYYQMR